MTVRTGLAKITPGILCFLIFTLLVLSCQETDGFISPGSSGSADLNNLQGSTPELAGLIPEAESVNISPEPSHDSAYVEKEVLVVLTDRIQADPGPEFFTDYPLSIKRVITCRWGTVYRLKITDGTPVDHMVDSLKTNPDIRIAEPNYLLVFQKAPYTPNDPLWESNDEGDDPRDSVYDQWGPAKLGANIVWHDSRGEGVIVAIIDTGIRYDHEDLAENIWINEDEIPDNGIDDDDNGYIDDYRGWDTHGNDNDPWDSGSHGTGCAGIVGAVQDNEKGLSGIAPGVKIMAVRADMWDGPACVATVVEAWNYVKDNGADVVSMSFVVLYPTEVLEIAADDTWDNGNGPLLMGAAGNWNNQTEYVPASYDSVICVGGTVPWSRYNVPVDEDRIHVGWEGWWWGSNYGPNLDIMGFCERTITTHSASTSSYRTGYTYGWFNGTSCACPTSAGVMALIVAMNPGHDGQWYWDRIEETADDLNVPGYDIQTGHGRINALRGVYGSDRYSDIADGGGFVQIPIDGATIWVELPLFDSLHDRPGNPYHDTEDLYYFNPSNDCVATIYLDIFTWGEDLDMAVYSDPHLTDLMGESTTENHADSSWEEITVFVQANTDYYLKIYTPAVGNSTTYGLYITELPSSESIV